MAKFETILEWCLRNGDRGKQVYDGFMRCEQENTAEGIFIDKYYPQITKVHLKCEEGHEMYYTLQRIKQDAWCRKCRWKEVNRARYDKKVEDGLSLSLEQWCFNNKDVGNRIITGYKKRENENLVDNMDISKIAYTASRAKMHFECEMGHRFDSYPYQVSLHGNWCPECAKLAQGKAQSATKIKKNGSFGSWIQEDIVHRKYILDGFVRCKELNGDMDLYKLPKRSEEVKLWMSCAKIAHQPWQVTTAELVRGRWCPYCARQTSFPEQLLYFWCKENFQNVYNRKKIRGNNGIYEADIFIEDLGLVIEYQGEYYHNGREAMDKKKAEFFKSMGYKELEIFGVKQGVTIIDKNRNIIHNCMTDPYCSQLIAQLVSWFVSEYNIVVTHKLVTPTMISKAKAVVNK